MPTAWAQKVGKDVFIPKNNPGINPSATSRIQARTCTDVNQFDFEGRTVGENWKTSRTLTTEGTTLTSVYTSNATAAQSSLTVQDLTYGRVLSWNTDYSANGTTAPNNAGANSSTLTFTLNRATSGFALTLNDIDKTVGTGTNTGWTDLVQIDGYASATGGTAIALTANDITLGTNNTNAFNGNNQIIGTGNNTTTDGNVTILFPSAVTRVVLTYKNAQTAFADPGSQVMGIALFNYCAQADVYTTLTAPALSAGIASGNYTATFGNNGLDFSQNTTRVVTIPANTASAVVSAQGTVAGSQAAGWTITYPSANDVATGAGNAVNYTFSLTPLAVGNIAVTSTTSTSTDQTITANDQVTVTTNVTPVADLTTTLTGPGSLGGGVASGNYTVTYTNNGPSPAATTTRTVTIPNTYVTSVSAPGSTSVNNTGGNYVITFPGGTTVPSGNTMSYTFTVTPTLTTSIGQTITATSRTAPGTGGTSQGNNTATDQASVSYQVGSVADVGVSFSSGQADNSTATAGTTVTYGVTFSNNGPASGTDVTRTVSIPAGVPSVTSAQGTVTGSQAAGWTITYPGGTIPLNVAGTAYSFSYVVPATGPVVITANTTTSAGQGTDTNPNSATRTLNVAPVALSGTVYDDVNYGGGAGRTYATANSSASTSGFANNAIGRANATVEVYDANGAFIASTTTSATGTYSFNLPAAGSYTVRVVNSTVTPVRTSTTANLVPVQTYVLGNVNRVGGENPQFTDAAANTGTQTLGNLSTGTITPQSLYTATFNTTATTGVDFGFNFDTVVNTNDVATVSGTNAQGSLRQFIINANAISNTNLDQAAASTGGANPAAGVETSIFMISNGTAVAGLRSGLTNQLTNGVAIITPAAALPALTGANSPFTSIDGTTQTQNLGNTNNVTLGTGGTTGTNVTSLGQLNGPEVQLIGSTTIGLGLDVAASATNTTIKGLAVLDFGNAVDNNTNANIRSAANNLTITQNVLGTTAKAFAAPTTLTNADNVRLTGGTTGVTVSNNLIGFANGKGVAVNGGVTNVTITNNEIRNNGQGNAGLDGVDIQGRNVAVTNNLITGTSGQGVDSYRSAGGNTITGNTITDNGRGTATIAPNETPGVRIYGSANNVSQNIIADNYGAGVMLEGLTNNGATAAVSTTVMSANSIYNNGNVLARNGAAATGQVGIDLEANGNSEPAGTSPFVTLNGAAITGANGLQDYPVITSATVVGTNLIVSGFAKPNAVIELFVAQANPSAVNATGTNFGQGRTYLTTLTEGINDNDARTGLSYSGNISGFDQGSDTNANGFTFSIPLTNGTLNGQAINTATLLTSTATIGSATSEFSGNARVLATPVPNDATNVPVATNTVTPVVLSPNLSATAFGFTNNVTTSTANTIASYTVSPISNGTLFLNGTAITAATTVTAANIGQLTFRPTFGFVGNAVFTYTATDANGTVSTTHNTGGNTVVSGAAVYTIPVAAAADLTTALTGPQTVTPGQPTGTYTATFTNEGPQAATAVAQTVTLPTGATNVFRNGVAYTATNGVIDFGTVANLAVNASNAFTFSFTPATTATGTVAITSNVATTGVSQGTNAAPDASTITATVALVADVATTLVANTTPVAAGTLATATNPAKFTVTFTNNGPATADGVTGRVQLPTGLTGVIISFPNGANGVSGSYNATTGVVTYSGATSIPSGGTITSGIAFDAPVNGPVVATSFISTTTNEAGKQANNTNNATININPAFDLATTISGPASAVAGDLITLAVMTTNNGPSAAPNAVQTVSLPQGLANVYVSNGGAYNGTAAAKDITVNGVTYTNVQPGQVVFPTLGSLPNGQTVANSVSFSQPASAYSPIAKLTTAGTGETNTANNTANLNGAASATNVLVADPVAGTANAYTSITSSVPSTTIGSPITLTVITGNNGPNQATGVIQTVLLLPGLTGVTSSNGGTYNSTTGIVTFLALTNGANGSTSGTSVSNTITFNAPASIGNNGQLLATAAVSTTNTDPIAADNVASVGVTLLQSTDLATTITGPASALVGQPVTYTATFTNNGPMTATNVTETAQLPAGLTAGTVVITDATGTVVTSASYNTTTGLVTLPTQTTVLNGASQVYNITFVAPSQTLVVRSSVSSSSADAVLANNNASTTTIMTASADLATTVAGPATAVIGSAVTYSVTTTNNGPSAAVNTVATLQLAQNLTTVSVPNGSYDSGSGLVTFNTLPSLASGATTSNYVTFVMPNATGGQTTGVASATSASTDLTPNNNTASVATSISPATTNLADITATITATPGPVAAGSNISLLVTYGNNGPAPATNVVPTLQLIPGLTNTSLSVQGLAAGIASGNTITFSNGAVYNTQNGIITFPTIAAQTGNQSYALNVTAPNNGPLVATAVTTSSTSEPATAAALANNTFSVGIDIAPAFDEVTRLSGPASAPVGSNLTYVVTATNNGPSVTTNATTQTVTLPTGVTVANISPGGTRTGNTITWTIPAGQAAGTNGAVANSFTIVQPAGGATVTANVTVTGESDTNNNSANLNGAATPTATTVTNQAPLAYAVVNTIQGPQSNDAGGLATGLLISSLNASDPENAFATPKYTVVTIPTNILNGTSNQGVLYASNNGTATGTYTAVTAGQTLTNAQAQTLRFKAATGYVGNASFTYLTTDAAGNTSPVVNYTIPVEGDAEAVYATVPAPTTTPYANGNVIAYVVDTNGATYDAATSLVYDNRGVRQGTAVAGVSNAIAGAFTSTTAGVTSLANLGLTLNPDGRIVLTNSGTIANPNLKGGSYSVSITTTDANGGVTTQVVSFVIPNNPLPVVLTAFTAQAVQNRDALLTWTTASEVNSAYFDVERSLDGTNFTKIGQQAAKGNSTTSNNYSFTDASAAARANGAVYYRLRQVDLDATASYSPIRTVSFTKVATVALSLYPNPAQNATTLDVSALPATGTYQVLVLDATGRAVRTASVGGGQLQTLSLTDLASGTYQVLVTGTLANGDALRQVIRLTKE